MVIHNHNNHIALQRNSSEEIHLLKKQVNELKFLISVASGQLNDHLNLASIRTKRQTSDGGDNLPVFDRAYGVDLDLKSNLHHYPYGYQKWRSSTPSSIDPNYSQQQQKIGDQNQNNQYNSNPSYQQDSNRKSQSAYAKRINAFRHSRVSSSGGRSNSQPVPFIPPTTTAPPVFKKPQLRSLDSGNFDKLRNSTSLHLQAKVSSADESAANLASGLHTSWRHSEWCKNNAFFKLDQTTGQIIVPEDGLYLIYVQVEYLDEHDVNGYEVYVDNEPTLSCVTTTRGHHSSASHSASSPELSNAISDQSYSGSSNSNDITSSFASTGSHKHKKHNTCFTSSVLFLKSGGKIHVRDKEAGRYSLFHSTGTFFGVTKLA